MRAMQRSQPSPAPLVRNFHHCSDDEYARFLTGLPVTPEFRRMRHRYRRDFVERWPKLEDWLAASLPERVGRLCGETQKSPSYPVSYRARSYLFYLALTDRVLLDYDWLLAIGDLAIGPVASPLGIPFGVPKLAADGVRHGYRPSSVAASMRWALSRIALHSGVRSADEVRSDHIAELLTAIERFDERHDISVFRTAGIASLKRYWRIDTRQLQLLLYHRGRVSEFPALPSKRREPPPSNRPVMQAPIDRWLSVRRLTLSPNTVDHQVVSLRHFMTHLARSAPEVRSFADVTRDQALGFVAAMAEDARSLKGTSLSIYARRARIAAVVVLQGCDRVGLVGYASPAVAGSQGYAADAAAYPALHSGRRAGSSHDSRCKPAVSLSTWGSARRPLVGRAPWGDMPARSRLPRRLPGRHSPAPHPGRQDAEGAGCATPRRSC